MSELKRYSCTVLVDASTGFNVEAISPEDAAEKAENLAAELGATSICHQCSANLEIGDFCGVMVYDEDLGEQVLDTTYGAEQIARLIHKLDAVAAQRDEGLAREAELKAQRDSLANEMFDLQQRLAEAEKNTFQARVLPWMNACFGEQISADKQERNHRFLEEALELIQACGATVEEAHQLVDYVYDRPVGEVSQEVGGVMVTLAALCLAQDMDMHAAAETELTRIWGKVEHIRAKQAAKPAFGPLPGSYPERVPGPSVSDQEQSS